jgi:hypothetical protein
MVLVLLFFCLGGELLKLKRAAMYGAHNRFGASEQCKRFPYVNMWDRAGTFPCNWRISKHDSFQEGLQLYLECRSKLCRELLPKAYLQKCTSCNKRMDVTTIVSAAPELLIVRLCPPYPPNGPLIPTSVRPRQLEKIVTFGETTYHLRNIIYLNREHHEYRNFEECGGGMQSFRLKKEVEDNAEVLFYSPVE